MMRNTALFYLLPTAGLWLLSNTALAAGTGECYPINNTPYQFEATFTKTITDPDTNVGGVSLDNFYTWNLGSAFSGYCNITNEGVTYYKAASSLAMSQTTVNTKTFYKINDYLSAAVSIYIGNAGVYKQVPFADFSNKFTESVISGDKIDNWYSGSRGKLDLYIEKPFVTSTSFSKIKIAGIYATRTPGNYANVPMAEVLISGSVTVPQGCEINAGQVISIDFGTINSRNFSTKGEKPDAVAPVEKNITFRCFGLTDTAKLSLRVMGRADADLPSAIASDKPGIGVMVANAQGNVLTPNSTKEPLPLNLPDPANNRNAEVTLQAWPVNTNGLPAPKGVFTATGTLQVDFD
ncbi:fimbrial protein [Serratia quinivorans]|uniref:fimbrial protein n=1 Tax=Serratia quinivorans TaxID=137545 RepID=UPI00217969F2|nr:fimbrial protein [Serratia quinivorans]CAI1755603.1 long polar fimbrial protein LpfD [Serratia quinivorans]CAI1879013.1 long polar fimbrial protein LpfD [Serratia quinivorans]